MNNTEQYFLHIIKVLLGKFEKNKTSQQEVLILGDSYKVTITVEAYNAKKS